MMKKNGLFIRRHIIFLGRNKPPKIEDDGKVFLKVIDKEKQRRANEDI